jgi:hypothetical protein
MKQSAVLQNAVQKAKLDNSDKQMAIKKLHELARKAEKDFIPQDNLDELIQKERDDSWKHRGRTVFGEAKPPVRKVNRSAVENVLMLRAPAQSYLQKMAFSALSC